MWGWNRQMWEKSKGATKCDKRTVTCDVRNAHYEDGTVKWEKKNKGTTKCEKRTVTCDIGIAQCVDRTIKCEKKVKESPNMTKELSYVILEPHNMRMERSNMRKKSKTTTKWEKKNCHM